MNTSSAKVLDSTPLPFEKPKVDKNEFQTINSFIYLRDGTKPSTNPEIQMKALNAFNESYDKVVFANRSLPPMSVSCSQFLSLYNNLNANQLFYFKEYLKQKDSTQKALIKARLVILRFYHSALFSEVLTNREAGHSELDPTVRNICQVPDRAVWKQLIFENYQKMNSTHLTLIGEKPAASALALESEFRSTEKKLEQERDHQQWAFIGGEIIVSIIGWMKIVSPFGEKVMKSFKSTRVGKIANYLIQGAYLVLWVGLDRYFTRNIFFLKEAPPIIDNSIYSSWERLISMGNQLVESDLKSPKLYSDYLKFIDTIRKEQVLDFIDVYKETLLNAEQKYGSIDMAYKNLKEASVQ